MTYGLRLKPAKPHHWRMGSGKATAKLGADAAEINPTGDWLPYDPERELQRKNGLETMACTNFATGNALIALSTFKKYLDFPKNISERYTGVVTGNSLLGNDPWDVIELIATQFGVIHSKVLPWTDDIYLWEQFYSPRPMDEDLVALGQSVLTKYEIEPEWVVEPGEKLSPSEKRERIKKALKRGPVCASVDAWNATRRVYVKQRGARDNHWVWLPKYEGDNPIARDQYEPFIKKLDKDYDFGCAILYFMRPNPTGRPPHFFKYLAYLVRKGRFAEAFALLIKKPAPMSTPAPDPVPTPHETPVKPPVSVPTPDPAPKDYIRLWALAIRDFEGFAAPGEKDRSGEVHPNGSHSWRRNNPGNIKSLDGKFIHYETYEKGFAALEDYLRRACTGKHKAYKPTMTLRQFYGVYAPDGNTIESAYANFVAGRLGVPVATQIKTLV